MFKFQLLVFGILCMYNVSYSYTDIQYTFLYLYLQLKLTCIYCYLICLFYFLNQSTRLGILIKGLVLYLKYSPITFVWVIKMYMIFLDMFRNSYQQILVFVHFCPFLSILSIILHCFSSWTLIGWTKMDKNGRVIPPGQWSNGQP